jgi:GAF domain-containing protein
MTRKATPSLKLHPETRRETLPPETFASSAVADLCRTFECAAGWQLSLTAGREGGARFHLEPSVAYDKPPLRRTAAAALASTICDLVGELALAQRALWEREAELAAGVPIAARPQEEAHLAERLEAVLAGGAKALDCQAAALYLLDDATSQLKLRAAFGLPKDRLLSPPRPLRGALADLEALVGHAVVIEDTSLLPHWKVPEKFASAVCVPVSSPSTPLGTLWLFCDEQRDFTDAETNIIEIVAGRIASDLEREMLLATTVENKKREQEQLSLVAWQARRAPRATPVLDAWQIATLGGSDQSSDGGFHDWTTLRDGRLAIVVGEGNTSLQGALTAAVTQAAFRSHAEYVDTPADLLTAVHETLWTTSSSGDVLPLAMAALHPHSGDLEIVLGRRTSSLIIARDGSELLGGDHTSREPESSLVSYQQTLRSGELALLFAPSLFTAMQEAGIDQANLTTFLRRCSAMPAAEIAEQARTYLERLAAWPAAARLIVMKCRATTTW